MLHFRYKVMLDTEQKSEARSHLFKLFEYQKSLTNQSLDIQESMDEQQDAEDDLFDSILKQKGMQTNLGNTQGIAQKIQEFEWTNSTDSDAIDFWHKRRFSHPELHCLAMTVFQVPGSQVSVERNFSSWKWILNDRRGGIDSQLLDDIMILNL
jgi:hypothetical protein